MNRNKLVRGFVLSTMIGLYIIVSLISTLHVIEFFEMSNPRWLAISLAVAFEIGAAASLASIIVLDKTSKTLVWGLFILLTAMQMQGNMFYAYTNLENFSDWIELFGLQEEDIITQKRILSVVSGAILPIIALGFIKSLVDYIKPDHGSKELTEQLDIEESINTPHPTSTPESQIVKEFQTEHILNPTFTPVTESNTHQQPLPSGKLETEPLLKPKVTPAPNFDNSHYSLPVIDAKTGNVVVEPKIATTSKHYKPKP